MRLFTWSGWDEPLETGIGVLSQRNNCLTMIVVIKNKCKLSPLFCIPLHWLCVHCSSYKSLKIRRASFTCFETPFCLCSRYYSADVTLLVWCVKLLGTSQKSMFYQVFSSTGQRPWSLCHGRLSVLRAITFPLNDLCSVLMKLHMNDL